MIRKHRGNSRAASRILGVALTMLAGFTTFAAIPSKPSPPRLVNDFAGVFSSMETATLERVLTDYSDSTSTQIAVVTANDLEGMSAAEYATRIGLEWQVGSEKFDNGVVILVKPKNAKGSGEVFIAVGYGLEGAIPDARAKGIIDRIMIPRFMENDYFGAVAGACEAIMKLANGEGFEAEVEDDVIAAIALLITVLIFTALIVFLIIKGGDGNGNYGGNGGGGRRTIYVGPTIRGGGFGGFSGGSSGGFGGFGGFGGGSFGGGGAGGRW
jgi:uncharacterized protein